MKKIELLAPAGDLEKLKYAVMYGADAVYLGGEEFSLRGRSGNFTKEKISEGIAFAHDRGVKVYVTVNTYPRDDEIGGITEFLSFLANSGADAVICADLGVFKACHEYKDRLDIHISTQANNVNYAACSMWHEMGAKRVNLARELSFEEIVSIRSNTPAELELEAFVHGAMCISYSGRCLLSNYMTGRDSNRGQCAQPCRWNYKLVEEKRPGEYFPVFEDENGTYIMNSKDLCMVQHVPQLIESGVNSIKIEGRVKTFYYVASVVAAYRKAIDDYYANPKNIKVDSGLFDEVCKVSHREYSTGFYFGKNRINQHFEDSDYIREYDVVGIVESFDEQSMTATIIQKNKFLESDEIEVLQPNMDIFRFVPHEMTDEYGNRIQSAPHPEMRVKMKLPRKISNWAILRKKA